jgi:hypothetical protein
MSDTLQSKKKRWHFSVEKDFVCNSRLSPMARMLYLVLMSYASPSSPVPFPGMRTLSTILQCSDDTIRKYRVELERDNWLEVEARRDGHNKFLSNAYVLLDGPEDAGAMPKKPDTAIFGHGENPSPLKPDTKSCTSTGEEVPIKSEAKTNQQHQYRASGDGGAGGESTPTAIIGPRSSAESFIQEYKTWGKAARISTSVVPDERKALQEFFTDNPEVSHRELFALMLCAWHMPRDRKMQDSEFNPYWTCNQRSKKIASFVKHLPKIQEETGWNPRMIEKQYQLAEQKFLQKAAA